MTDFIEIFSPGMRHLQEQRDLDKVYVMEQKKGGAGPRPLDLNSGSVNVVLPKPAGDTTAAEESALSPESDLS